MVNIIELVPMKILFVVIFSLLPIALTLREVGYENVSTTSWVGFGLLFLGVLLTYVVANTVTSVQMQTYLWPLLSISAVGLLLYRRELKHQDRFDEQSVERGGTDYS
ncbi:hypothetical protein KTS45_18935 [Halomicroarcula limicola]|uniref:Uncharacterized protein n=1 Tax=Haloarcula limicola TaxID=1429915 RepID=A0A8J7Y8Y9_9EURY|nr:hypothetical protein [Halomicroarcula limicola]MBV0926287.1 hypothetical protein [Halomicroarcula limicola]